MTNEEKDKWQVYFDDEKNRSHHALHFNAFISAIKIAKAEQRAADAEIVNTGRKTAPLNVSCWECGEPSHEWLARAIETQGKEGE